MKNQKIQMIKHIKKKYLHKIPKKGFKKPRFYKNFINETSFLEFSILDNLSFGSSSYKNFRAENLMILQEKKRKKNFSINIGSFSFTQLFFVVFLVKRKKISRAKFFFLSQLKLILKFPKFNIIFSKIVNIILKIFSLFFQSFSSFPTWIFLVKKTLQKSRKFKIMAQKVLSFFFFQERSGLFDFLVSFAAEKQNVELKLKLKILKSIGSDLRDENFRKYYLENFLFFSFFQESKKEFENFPNLFLSLKFPLLKRNLLNSFLFSPLSELVDLKLILNSETPPQTNPWVTKKAFQSSLFFLKPSEIIRKKRVKILKEFHFTKKGNIFPFFLNSIKKKKFQISQSKKNFPFKDFSFFFFFSRIVFLFKLNQHL